MKISPYMLEAGVAAMARIKRTNPVDASVVNVVFSAMYSAMETERKRNEGTLKPVPYAHQDWPAWRYGPDGSGQVFNAPEEVPDGWSSVPSGLPRAVETFTKRKYTRRAKSDGPDAAY